MRIRACTPSGPQNEPVRQAVLVRLNSSQGYRAVFGEVFPVVRKGTAIDFTMFARVVAEFGFTLIFADSPLHRFARGDSGARS